LAEFTDEAVNDAALNRIRLLTEANGDSTVEEDGVVVEVGLKDGRSVDMHLTGSLGNLKRPLSDAQLEAKFRDQARVITPDQADQAIRACWTIEQLDDAARLITACIPH
jgi:hypothetical protein